MLSDIYRHFPFPTAYLEGNWVSRSCPSVRIRLPIDQEYRRACASTRLATHTAAPAFSTVSYYASMRFRPHIQSFDRWKSFSGTTSTVDQRRGKCLTA